MYYNTLRLLLYLDHKFFLISTLSVKSFNYDERDALEEVGIQKGHIMIE